MPTERKKNKAAASAPGTRPQVVLVLQGGGTIDPYQVGLVQAMHQASIDTY